MMRSAARALACIVALIAFAIAADSASATIYGGDFCMPDGTYVYLASGGNCTHGTYHGDTRYIENKSDPFSGLPGVYMVDSSGTRISANNYCDTVGCTAYENFSSGIGGYANSHNHGGYGSDFQGFLNYNA